MELTAQVIALGELSKPTRAEVIAAAQADAKKLHPNYSSTGVEELAVEIAVSCALILGLMGLTKKSSNVDQ